MIVLKFPCCLAHCWHHILLLFHFGRMCRSRNQNCYCKCYCNQKILHFGRMLWSWKYHCCHWSHCAQIGFPCTVAIPQVCLHHCEARRTSTCTSPCLREYFSLGGCAGLVSYNIFGYCTVNFNLGWCVGVVMSNVIGGGVVTPLSLELAQWYCWEGLFRLVAFTRAHH